MNKTSIILTAILLSIVSVCYADDKKPTPIPIGPKGSTTGPESTELASITLSAVYDSDSLYIAFSSYSGMAAIAVKDAVTGQTVIQTLKSINGTDHSVAAADISSLPEGLYTLSILTQDGMEYEGTFTIGWQSSLLSETP